MKPIHISEDVVTVAHLKAHASNLIRKLADTRRPIIITKSGVPAAVLLHPAEFDELSERERLVAAVQEGLEDLEAGRVMTTAELKRAIDEDALVE
jgi:prevent-host-death family protein